MLFLKIIETFWSRDITNIWVLAHFELKMHKELIKSLYTELS